LQIVFRKDIHIVAQPQHLFQNIVASLQQ